MQAVIFVLTDLSPFETAGFSAQAGCGLLVYWKLGGPFLSAGCTIISAAFNASFHESQWEPFYMSKLG